MILPWILGWAAAVPVPQEAPFRLEEIPSPAGERTLLPALNRGADGRLRLSWVERGAGEVTLLFSTLGEGAGGERRWEAPREIASGKSWFVNWTDFPSICALADGTLLAHWLEKSGEGTYAYGARVTLSKDGGDAWTEPVWLHEDRSPVEHGFVSLAALDEERFGALWLDGRAMHGEEKGATALYFRTVSTDGELGDEVLLDERVCDCCPTDLQVRDRAHCAVYRDRSDAEVRDVSFVLIELDGNEIASTTPTPVHRDDWTIPGCPVNGPVLALSAGGAACVWYTGALASGGQVLASRMERDSFVRPVRVDDGAPEGRVDAVMLDDGALVVSWLEHGEDGAAWHLKRIDEAGQGPIGASFVVDEVTSGRESGLLRMARDGEAIVLAWTTGEGRIATARVVPAE